MLLDTERNDSLALSYACAIMYMNEITVRRTMNRTTIMLPETLKGKATYLARQQGISLGELIRELLESRFRNTQSKKRDCFYADESVFSGDAPADLSTNHDDYLY